MLVAWYFILPPSRPKNAPAGHSPSLVKWKILRSFEDAPACLKFADSLKKSTHEMMALRTLSRSMCVSSDDPRLQPDAK
jgi:hypothetical protein